MALISSFHILLTATLFLCCTSAHAQNTDMEADMFADMRTNDKAAVVAVHFGTTSDAARILSIERFNTRIKETFPLYDFREAWTSQKIIDKIKDKEIIKQTPRQILEQLKLDGFTHILIQPSFVIEGVEMDYLKYIVNLFQHNFKSIRLSQPLLANPADYEKVVEVERTVYKDKKSMNVLVCHGSMGSKNTQYTMLDYVIRDEGLNNWTVATIEGYPSFEHMLRVLKASGIKKVNLIPFLFLAGEYAEQEISVKWRKALESEGYKVKVMTHGLGESDAINAIYADHAKYTQKHKIYTSFEQKLQNVIQ